MSDTHENSEPAYHLFLDAGEVPVARVALNLLISDEAHEPLIRRLAREVIAELELDPDETGMLTVALTPQQMKITHTAVQVLVNDLGRDEADERNVLRGILGKLPDEHAIRAIELD